MKTIIKIGLATAIVIYSIYWVGTSSTNPDSWNCIWHIYENKQGQFEVWEMCKYAKIKEGTFNTLEEARNCQSNCCFELNRFESQSPSGKWIK